MFFARSVFYLVLMRVLAIDLGLRIGFALYQDDCLVRYSSTHFASNSAMKKAIWNILKEEAPLDRVVAEGDRNLAAYWEKAAVKQGATFERISAETWRPVLFYDREQRGSATSKQSAVEHARGVIEADDAARPRGDLDDNAAEAILVGLWAVGRELPR